MARDASAFGISTKPKPRGRPVSRSVISETFSTIPCLENNSRTESSVALKGRLPTYSFVTAITHDRNGKNRQVESASWLVADIGHKARRGGAWKPRKSSRNV